MVRPLVYGEKQAAGEHSLAWDGLDRYGQPQPPGTYEWRVLRTPGFRREFLLNVGTTITWAPFGWWPGNHYGPSCLFLKDGGDLYVGSVSSEGPPSLIRMSQDGKQLRWGAGVGDGLVDLAAIGDVVYLLFADGALRVFPANGAAFTENPKLQDLCAKWVVFTNLLHAGASGNQFDAMNMDAGRDFLVVTYRQHDEVRFLWPKGETVERVKSVKVPRPLGVAVAPDGRVFVSSASNRIACVDAAAGTHRIVVDDPTLDAVTRMAYEPVTGDLLVLHHWYQVRRYSASDGKPVATYGERPTPGAVFVPLNFSSMLDIAADGKGGFFIVDVAPRRVAHFTGREKHELVQQWFGGMPWGWQARLDGARPQQVYLGLDSSGLCRGAVDYSGRSWTVTHYFSAPARFGAGGNTAEARRDVFPPLGVGWKPRHVGAHTYLVNDRFGAAVARIDEKAGRLIPLARLGGLHPSVDRLNPPAWWLDAVRRAGRKDADPRDFDSLGKYTHFDFSWSDVNQNGAFDAEEVRVGSVGVASELPCAVDKDWNVFYPWNATKAPGAWCVIPNEGTPDAPAWNWDHAKPGAGSINKRESDLLAPDTLQAASLFRGAEGGIYMTFRSTMNAWVPDYAPLAYPNYVTRACRLVKWDAQGRQMFCVGRHTGRPEPSPGAFANILFVVGEARRCVVVADSRSPATVWTRDGLYAGSFLDGRVADGLPDAAYGAQMGDDTQDGDVVETTDGQVLWGANSSQSTPYYRIHGWDGWERLSGKLDLNATPAAASWNGAGLRGEYFPNADLAGEPAREIIDPEIWFGPLSCRVAIRPKRLFLEEKPPAEPDGMFAGEEPPALTEELRIEKFSARWTGFFDAPLGDPCRFVIMTYGASTPERTAGAKVRFWADSRLIIDSWDDVRPEACGGTRLIEGPWMRLTPGRRVPLKLEFSSSVGPQTHLHLFWESPNWELRHVPQALLHPSDSAGTGQGRTVPGQHGRQ
jgi:hypothetical protein